MSSARMRRLASDYEQIKKEFSGHKYIIVTPIGEEPYDRYRVTYFVNGIFMMPNGVVQPLGRHEVEITLHSEYPRYKPICKILTPIWHPNFRDGQICIGDIWGAGESLSDIIINIGDMIQYKSWNASSPLSADAARWAIENKHMFPVGNLNLYSADYAAQSEKVEIDLMDENDEVTPSEEVAEPVSDEKETVEETAEKSTEDAVNDEILAAFEKSINKKPQNSLSPDAPPVPEKTEDGNDFDITAEELEGIEFVPTAQRMQTMAPGGVARGGRLNFKTILVKGLLFAFIGAILGFIVSEFTEGFHSEANMLKMFGHEYLAESAAISEDINELNEEFYSFIKSKGVNPDDETDFVNWYQYEATQADIEKINELMSEVYALEDEQTLAFTKAVATLVYDEGKIPENERKYDEDSLYDLVLNMDDEELERHMDTLSRQRDNALRMSTAFWSAILAMFIGLLLGIGEGVFYGSARQAVKFGLVGLFVAAAIGFASGYLAQWMYAAALGDDPSLIAGAFIRGIGWAIMGLGVGFAVGLIKINWKRILFCIAGGTLGAFMGGFAFDFIMKLIPNDIVARGVGILFMGLLIGLGIGFLEQVAKEAWLKVVRGEFEGKEYLVFTGTTSIGNSGKNSIVLFKDKLVGPHHCDIVLEGNKYVLLDCGTPMGTVVNGMKTQRHLLRNGDAIAIGNSVLVFHTK